MKTLLTITLLIFTTIIIYISCTNNEALFDPTGETGITVSAFVCDTTGLDISLSDPDSLPFNVYTSLSPVLAGQTISFLGFIENDSGVSGLAWSWEFGDGNAAYARIIEHKYLDAGNYNAVFTVTNSLGVTLSDTVTISVSKLATNAAVRGFAYLKGKVEHDNIQVIFRDYYDTNDVIRTLITRKDGKFEELIDIPNVRYSILFLDKKVNCFTSFELEDTIITQGIMNELGTIVLQDDYLPHIVNLSPTGTKDIRIPPVKASFIDTASGIARETFIFIFNGDSIPNSLIFCNDTGFSWTPDSSLPDGIYSVYASIADSAGNKDSITWSFTVDAMKFDVIADSMVSIYDTISFSCGVSNVYSKVEMYKFNFDGNSTWDDSISTSDTIVSVKHSYSKDSSYAVIVCARDDYNMIKYDTAIVTVRKYSPFVFAGEDTVVSINDTIRLHGTALDTLRTITSWAWDIGNTGAFVATTTLDTNIVASAVADSNYQCVLRVTDDDENIVYDTVVIAILKDIPVADAGNDITAGFGNKINLQGIATQQFGIIVKWKWKIGDNPWAETSSGDTSFVPPRIPKTYVCSLQVTDDDGLTDTDWINVSIQVIFTAHTISNSANGASSIYAIDIDGDNDIDVVSASSGNNNIAWYENDGVENFTTHSIITFAPTPNSVYVIDIDGDNDVDVISATSELIAWHENDGSGSFTTNWITNSINQAQSIFALDVDGDSDIDVLSASSGDNKITLYENDGVENFTENTITTSAIYAQSVFAIDVDGDGDIDVLSASVNDNKIAWYENDGAEIFTTHTITASASGARSVFAIDLDRDGDIDVLSASSDMPNDLYKIAWYENDGNQHFTGQTITTSARGAYSVYAIDVDGDGDIDVLSASYIDDKIVWYENDGDENFTAHTVTTSAKSARSVFAIDIDGDGDVDVLSASANDNKIAWYENGD